jgi:hypothetical protein
MVGLMKEYQLSADYRALAILLARHTTDKSNTDIQWSAHELSEKLKNLQLAHSANLHVDSDPLQHRLSLFQRILNK